MIQIDEIKSRLAELLTDEEYDFWLKDFHQHSINEAVIAIQRLLMSSDKVERANKVDISLVDGALQALPDDCYRLVDVISDQCGRNIDEKSFDELSGFDPCWQEAEQIQGIEFYAYDQSTNRLWVYPNAKAGDKVTISYVPKVKPVEATDTEIDLDADYLNDIINFCLYRAYQREGTQTHKEAFYRSAFYEGFGLKVRMDATELHKEHPDGK